MLELSFGGLLFISLLRARSATPVGKEGDPVLPARQLGQVSQNPPKIEFFYKIENVTGHTYSCIHALCFISNVYKQRFLGLVKILKKLNNRTSLF